MTLTLTKSQNRTLRAIDAAGGIVGIWLKATRAIGANMASCDVLVARGLLEKAHNGSTWYFLITGAGYDWLAANR